MNNAPAVWDFASETAVRFVEHYLELPFGTLTPAVGLLVVQDSEPIAAVAYHNYRELSGRQDDRGEHREHLSKMGHTESSKSHVRLSVRAGGGGQVPSADEDE